jgi:GNAT superfamily N-acetyltransferase/uncharacterized glyoxalase superfamily protein PhnB
MIRKSEPIFAVSDVRATIAYYRTVLGFESEWLWGDPPTFGAVLWEGIQIMFCLQPDLQPKVGGHQHMFMVENVQELYERHKAAGAEIFSEIGNKPWGVCEYTVRDLNGYHLRFGGPEKYERAPSATDQMPTHVRIDPRLATLDEYLELTRAVGWNPDAPNMSMALTNSLLGVVAIDTRENKTIGMVRACGDGRFFTIWDVMVAPPYQGQKIGTAMIEATLAELRRFGPRGAFVGLFAFKAGFYTKLGFVNDGGFHRPL